MNELYVAEGGEITLPEEVRARYGLAPKTSVRVIETRTGILLVPLTDAPMSEALAAELEDWQALASESWGSMPFEDDPDASR